MSLIQLLQIGANDGSWKHDKIVQKSIKKGDTALLVEPIPFMFRRLVWKYGELQNVTLENCAISTESGEAELFIPGKHDYQYERATLIESQARRYNTLLTKIRVQCMTFHELLDKHSIAEIEFLMVDAEGFDVPILASIDHERVKINQIMFEHHHADREQLEALMDKLKDAGFRFYGKDAMNITLKRL